MLIEQTFGHCTNLKADRSLGKYWERRFCEHSAAYGLSFTPQQIGRRESAQAFIKSNGKWHPHTLPDITIWTAPGQHHEVKHKNPCRDGTFGLEVYRFDALIWFADQTQQAVYYTIHNHDLSGGRGSKIDKIEHWLTVNVRDLINRHVSHRDSPSWVNGQKRIVPTYYWPQELWKPLKPVLSNRVDHQESIGEPCFFCGSLVEGAVFFCPHCDEYQ